MELEKLALGEKKDYPEWDIKDLTLMSPGPTQVAPNVRKVRSYNVSSPIVDKRFFDFYKENQYQQSTGAHLHRYVPST